MDSGGNTLLYYYQNDLDPTTISIVEQPLDQDIMQDDTVTFRVLAVGPGPITYQWTHSGVNIDGATSSSYTVDHPQPGADDGSYAVTVSIGTRSLTSRTAQLTLEPASGYPFYMELYGQRQDYEFKPGVTYAIFHAVQLYGDTVVDGGTVIKFDPGYVGSGDASLQIRGSLRCNTEPYNPAILTTLDDDSAGIGFFWPLEAQQPTIGKAPFLDLTSATSGQISNLRFSYANLAVTTPSISKSVDVWDCQFVECNGAIDCEVGNSAAVVGLHNVLFSAPYGCAVASSGGNVEIDGEQVTADVRKFSLALLNTSEPVKVLLTNSIIKGGLGDTLTSLLPNSVVDSGAVFQPVGAGSYYLPSNSPYHHAGTTLISPTLLAELENKTTYAPISLPTFMENHGDITLGPQALRYTSGAPDIGYYYDVLDYTVADVQNFGNIKVLPGTAIGYRQEIGPDGYPTTWLGFDLRENSSFVSHGTPERPDIFTDVQMVQEQFEWAAVTGFRGNFQLNTPGDRPPQMDFRFCNFYVAGYASWYGQQANHIWSGTDDSLRHYVSYDSSLFLTMRDCKVTGGEIQFGNNANVCYTGSAGVSLINNSFDGVTVNIAPTWSDSTDSCNWIDMSFTAYNNLFKGGLFFHLEPIQASAGNWVLKNNLFDHVNIIQDLGSSGSRPLDYDHNAYWPLTQRELDFGWTQWGLANSAQLQPTASGEGSHEVLLASAPPYQTGPFGDFYLPNSTALYGAGSDTPANLGLYHYTTRIDQVKEGEEFSGHNANIGVHYVATSGSSSALSKDADNDGIPDYVENWHGDGDTGLNRVHATDETDWNNQHTIDDVWDPTNSVYDDVDLSGNGLVGRIKRALAIGPFDSLNPLALTKVTREGSDIVTFEIPVNFDSMQYAGQLTLRANGSSVFNQDVMRAENGHCIVRWNTTFEPPGEIALQVQWNLYGKSVPGEIPDLTVLKASGPITQFNSTNVVQFDPFYAEYDSSNGATLYARLPSPDYSADYSIDLRTPSNDEIVTFTGHVDAGIGEISQDWSGLLDKDGAPYTGDSATANFNVTITDPFGATQHGLHGFQLYSNNLALRMGDFTVAYGWHSDWQARHGLHDMIQYGVVDPLLKPTGVGGISDFPYHSLFNEYTWSGNLNGDPGYLATTNDVNGLTNNLAYALTKNFYFYGHGSVTDLGGADDKIDISSVDLGSVLQGKNSLQRLHPYRFVFLDACDTAGGLCWAKAFGILPRLTAMEIYKNPEKGQAFLGWVNNEPGPVYDSGFPSLAKTYTVFFSAWMNGYPLEDCINFGNSTYPYGKDEGTELDWPFDRVPPFWPNNFWMRIYGYAGLTKSAFHWGYDNSPYYR